MTTIVVSIPGDDGIWVIKWLWNAAYRINAWIVGRLTFLTVGMEFFLKKK